jgi:hypothetical protein
MSENYRHKLISYDMVQVVSLIDNPKTRWGWGGGKEKGREIALSIIYLIHSMDN